MSALIPYIVFPGTCREAMVFYRDVLGGEITLMQTFGESPVPVPEELAQRIFNAEVRAGDVVLKASDDLPGHNVTMGTNISLYVVFTEADRRKKVFDNLAKGGKVLFPLDGNFGMLKDPYGVQWMLVLDA